MKTASVVYFAATLLAVIGAALRMTHVINKPVFYLMIAISIGWGIWGNILNKPSKGK
jgi:predicted tellurium resistance membrane protein TerC